MKASICLMVICLVLGQETGYEPTTNFTVRSIEGWSVYVNNRLLEAVKSKKYESVLYYHGKPGKAYALNNEKEYFAELTEAYFGTNDMFPFVRAEIKTHDPLMYETLKKIWGE